MVHLLGLLWWPLPLVYIMGLLWLAVLYLTMGAGISVVSNGTTLEASIACRRIVGVGSHLGIVRCLFVGCGVVVAWSLGIIALLLLVLLLLGLLLLLVGWVGRAGLRSLLVGVARAIAAGLRLGGIKLPLFPPLACGIYSPPQ